MAGKTEETVVAAARLESYAQFDAVLAALRSALSHLGGMSAFVKPGQRVLLKVNLVAPSAPDLAVTTHPSIVRAAIRLVREAGGLPRVGDGPGVGDTATAARVSGIAAVVEEEGAELVRFQDTALYDNAENAILKRLPLTSALQDTDVLITLPKLKTHCQMAFTGALKNQYGLIPGSAKGQYHFRFQDRDRLADLMIDVNRTAHPALAIMDAVMAMEGPGPSGGTPRYMGVLLCGADLAAVDAVACAAINLPLSEVPVQQAAIRAGFGVSDLARIRLCGLSLEEFRVPDFQLVKAPLNIMRILPLPQFALRWIRSQLAPRPQINPEKCIKCRRCERGCPVKPAAIEPVAEGGSRVNDRTCIRCYCCHEFCPVKAIDLKKGMLARLLNLSTWADRASRLLGRVAALFRRGGH
ncbi:MAG: DUF362 domain-containing protein [Victivallales bacterium]|nr:DUF362 domain-containing protein [Victivallales bacterium]